MPETVSLQIRPGVIGYFQKTSGSDENDSNIGAIPIHSIKELVDTNLILESIDGKIPTLNNERVPVVVRQDSNGTLTSRNGDTSATPNTLTQIFATQTTRSEWFLMNLNEDYTLEIWYGTTGNEILVNILDPGEKYYRAKSTTGFNDKDLGVIKVKSLGSSIPFIAWEVI